MGVADLPVPLELEPMEAKAVEDLPAGPGWWFEPKWDGFRCVAFRAGDQVELRAKSGKPLQRFFPEVVARLRAAAPDPFVLDAELVIPQQGTLSFDALQMRLHPAESRIRKLSQATPAFLIAFDCLLAPEGAALLEAKLRERRVALARVVAGLGKQAGVTLSPVTEDRAEAARWLAGAGAATDGVIAKPAEGAYRPGERAMLKVKPARTADCVVGGFRYETKQRQVGSLLLGLYDEHMRLNHVGFTSGIAAAERPALTERLEALRGPSAFDGAAPGAPSRWSTERSTAWEPLRPELVVEVRYDHVTAGRFRHGTSIVRWRPDKAPRQCTCEQIVPLDKAEAIASLFPAAT